MMRWLRTVLVAVGLAGLLTVAAPGSAWACSCVSATFAEQLDTGHATVVFAGTPAARGTAVPENVYGELVPWTFTVNSVYRGAATRTTTIWSPMGDSACGLGFEMGQRHVVLATLDPSGRTISTLCSGTALETKFSAGDLGLLGTGTPPTPDPVVLRPDDVPLAPALWTAAAMMGVLAVVVVVVLRRRRD